ncbi:hypothetical protein HYFRA_00013680 [Hymenoscyphus fraxineus]|uniref:Uncharacterized protein n=1 Tax=Hymenoscyphus fraxineus TaxID=746836 RepID=A0A9N9PZX6_9HELO|nr:hypothetical protein HYFRA_00013680 [Hymenoscyphus fraxineus]
MCAIVSVRMLSRIGRGSINKSQQAPSFPSEGLASEWIVPTLDAGETQIMKIFSTSRRSSQSTTDLANA